MLLITPMLAFGVSETMQVIEETGNSDAAIRLILHKTSVFIDGSVLERFSTFKNFTNIFSQYPPAILFGFGAGTFEELFGLNVHNSYLDLFFATGLIGFLAITFLFMRIMYRFANTVEKDGVMIGLVFALISLTAFMFAHDILRGRIVWTIAALLVLAISAKNKNIRKLK